MFFFYLGQSVNIPIVTTNLSVVKDLHNLHKKSIGVPVGNGSMNNQGSRKDDGDVRDL